MFRKIILLLSFFIISMPSYAVGVDMALSNDSAYFKLLFNSSSFGVGGADVGIGYYYDEDGDTMATATALIMSEAEPVGSDRNKRASNFMQYGIGVKGYLASLAPADESDDNRDIIDDESASALAIGGNFRLIFPTAKPIAIAFDLFASPKITSFSDTDYVFEFGARLELEIRPDARAYVGYRYIRTKLEDYEPITIDNSPVVGMRLIF
jgi:hypothetical protein